MKKYLLLFVPLCFLIFSCGGDSDIPEKEKPKTPVTPEKPEISISATIILPDTINLKKQSAISLKTETKFDKVEYYLNGELVGTSINSNFSYNWVPENIKAGKQNVKALGVFEGKTYTFESSTFLKILVGDKYEGGSVIMVYESGINGLIAANKDLVDPDDDERFRWGENGVLVGANSDDGEKNTELIIKAYSNQNSTFAYFLKDGIEIDGFNDWYVPSLIESKYINADVVPNINKEEYYWTSTEVDSDHVVFCHFKGSLMGTNQSKRYLYHVRLIRKF